MAASDFSMAPIRQSEVQQMNAIHALQYTHDQSTYGMFTIDA